jgi:hypothetical protein
MKEELEKAVKSNATKAADAKTADEALKYSQASLNAAHALVTVANIK